MRKLWYVFFHIPLSDISSDVSDAQYTPPLNPARSTIPVIVFVTSVASHRMDGTLLSDDRADQLLYVENMM